MKQDKTIHDFSIKLSLSGLGQDKSKLQKQIRNFYQAAVAIKINNLLICFCIFDLSSPIPEKDSFIENVHIVLSCLIK